LSTIESGSDLECARYMVCGRTASVLRDPQVRGEARYGQTMDLRALAGGGRDALEPRLSDGLFCLIQ